jgi:hypothetical protein
MTELLDELLVHHLRFTLRAQNIIRLGRNAGSQLRGAFWHALRSLQFTDYVVHELIERETADAPRGSQPVRPFAIQPPLPNSEQGLYLKGNETFSVGMSLFGDVAVLFPYVIQAVAKMGELGVGHGRGTFALEQVQAVNLLSRQTQTLFEDGVIREAPGIPVSNPQVQSLAAALPTDEITLRFLTPVQLKHRGKSVPEPYFDVLIARLIERCQAIAENYTSSEESDHWRELYLDLTAQAQLVDLYRFDTHWLTLRSGSRRTNTTTSMSGLLGTATYRGELSTFNYWLLWGQSTQVGKNATKGNGWYEVVPTRL